MSAEYMVIGHFGYVDDTKDAIVYLKEQGYQKFELFSPVPDHELEEEAYAGKRRSPVRMFTLLGGWSGCLGAFLMTIWMSVDWPLRTSAKSIISIPPFVIIAFECTILLGALFTLAGMFYHSRIPHLTSSLGYRPNFTEDTFGLTIRVDKDAADVVKHEFVQRGAKEVEVIYAR